MAEGDTDYPSAQISLASQSLTIDKVNGECPIANVGGTSTVGLPNDPRELQDAPTSASATAGNDTVIAGLAGTSSTSTMPTVEAMPRENTPNVGEYRVTSILVT